MARYTADPTEVKHLNDTDQQLTDVASKNGWRVKVILIKGKPIVGHLAGSSGGNNMGKGGFWAFYGDATIVDDNGNPNVIDRLDIARVEAP